MNDSASSGERTWIRLNRMCVIPGRGCMCGVVGCMRAGSAMGWCCDDVC